MANFETWSPDRPDGGKLSVDCVDFLFEGYRYEIGPIRKHAPAIVGAPGRLTHGVPGCDNGGIPPQRLARFGKTERLAIPPKPYDMLRYLVENPGRLVTQDEFLEKLWPETYVIPELIRKYILDTEKSWETGLTNLNSSKR